MSLFFNAPLSFIARGVATVAAVISGVVQGSTSGYSSGGVTNVPTNTRFDVIDKFPFASDTNATDVGDLTVARNGAAGQSSTVSGYSSGGFDNVPTNVPINTRFDVIDKFPFASDTNATDVGDLTVVRSNLAGQSSSESGYSSGGFNSPPATYHNIIDKFPFASDGNATDVGDLTVARSQAAGQSSTLSGYSSGGSNPSAGAPWGLNMIDKFPFASDGNATDVGDLTAPFYDPPGYAGIRALAGQSSTESGYSSGGYDGNNHVNTIDKFPFASDGNATDVGDLTVGRSSPAGQSSTESGYSSGGFTDIPTNIYVNTIDKFPFSSDGNATDVGDLTVDRGSAAGQQV